MDVNAILPTLPLPAGILFSVFILSRMLLNIIDKLAESRVKITETNLEISKADAQAKIRTAELLGQAQIKAAEVGLETAKQQSEAQRQALEREAKLATELDAYRTQADSMRLEQARTIQATVLTQAETVRVLTGLAGAQKATTAAVKGSETRLSDKVEESEKRLGGKVEGARDDIIEGIIDYRDFSLLYWGMLVEDPPASRDRLKRARDAWDKGDMQEVKDVADEKAGNGKAMAKPTEGIAKLGKAISQKPTDAETEAEPVEEAVPT